MSKLFFSLILGAFMVGCSSTSNHRMPSGTGDIDSSGGKQEFSNAYKLPITRASKVDTRVALDMWTGEWPMPVIDVHSNKKGGKTTVSGYLSLRELENNKASCTIKNGIYHPWSKNDDSAYTYYTITAVRDYEVLKTVKLEGAPPIPKGSTIENVVYYSEGYCGATIKTGKNRRALTEPCDIFDDKSSFKNLSKNADNFSEQWIYVRCEEEVAQGAPLKVFIRDKDLLATPGIEAGCPIDYGSVGPKSACRERDK